MTIFDERRNDECCSQGQQSKYSIPEIDSDYKDALNSDSIHGIVIATPAATHYTITKEALLAGKDVLVEKPLALNINEAQELIELAKKQKKI